jgi:transposase
VEHAGARHQPHGSGGKVWLRQRGREISGPSEAEQAIEAECSQSDEQRRGRKIRERTSFGACAGSPRPVRRHLADLDQGAADLDALDQALAAQALKDGRARRLMTLSGVHVTIAMGLLAAIGDFTRFASSEKLVSYLGLNLSEWQSGNRPAQHGRITEQGRSHARAMMVEATWATARAPDPLRAFFQRIQTRRGKHVAAVATACKMVVLVWHLPTKEKDHAWSHPALLQAKLRKAELAAGQPAGKGSRPGRAHAHNNKQIRERERAWAEQTESAYARFVANWQTKPPAKRTGAGVALHPSTCSWLRAHLSPWRSRSMSPIRNAFGR